MPKKDSKMPKRPLTAAELLQKTVQQKKRRKTEQEEPKVDLDDEIQRLEAELQAMSSSDDDESDISEEEENSKVVALSSVKDDRIESLPPSALPAIPPDSKKQRKTNNTEPKTQNNRQKTAPIVSQGLKDAVQEVLRGYKPRSAEHLPFYCRCCAKQYENIEQFQAHKTSDFHKAAVELERKASFCRSCRKQLTSPAQLQEHLQSRPHKERLQKLKAKQQQSKKF